MPFEVAFSNDYARIAYDKRNLAGIASYNRHSTCKCFNNHPAELLPPVFHGLTGRHEKVHAAEIPGYVAVIYKKNPNTVRPPAILRPVLNFLLVLTASEQQKAPLARRPKFIHSLHQDVQTFGFCQPPHKTNDWIWQRQFMLDFGTGIAGQRMEFAYVHREIQHAARFSWIPAVKHGLVDQARTRDPPLSTSEYGALEISKWRRIALHVTLGGSETESGTAVP